MPFERRIEDFEEGEHFDGGGFVVRHVCTLTPIKHGHRMAVNVSDILIEIQGIALIFYMDIPRTVGLFPGAELHVTGTIVINVVRDDVNGKPKRVVAVDVTRWRNCSKLFDAL